MEYLQKIDELLKSEFYIKSTKNPYPGEDPSDIMSSRIVPERKSKMGWRIIEFYPCTPSGRESAPPIPYNKFMEENSVNEEDLTRSISIGMSEIFNQSWIDEYAFPSDREFALIYLGKIGIEIKGKLYVPVFQYTSGKNVQGDGLWISAQSRDNKDTEDIEQMAKTPSLYMTDLGNGELERKSLDRLNSSIIAKWEAFKQEGREKGLDRTKTKPRTYSPDFFSKKFIVIREVKDNKREPRKDFFIIYKDTMEGQEAYDYASYEVTGKMPLSSKKIIGGIGKKEDDGRKKAKGKEYFNLDPKDKRLEIFYYFNDKKDANPALFVDKYTALRIVPNSVEKVDKKYLDRRKIGVISVTGNKPGTRFTLTIDRGDKLKVPYIKGRTPLEQEGEKTPFFKEAIVGTTEELPLNKKRVRVIYKED